jgi:hypothetical protein
MVAKTEMFSDEERQHLHKAFLALTNEQIRMLLRDADVRPIGDSKADFDRNLRAAITNGRVTYSNIVEWLDRFDPWRRQQVFLFGGREQGVGPWADQRFVRNCLVGHEQEACFNTRVPVVLPNDLKVSSIRHRNDGLQIIAYIRREHRIRTQERDKFEVLENGDRIVYHAFHEFVVRTAVIFEWDFVANTAVIRITQLPSRENYEDVRDIFISALRGWFQVVDEFPLLDLRRAIGALHRHEAGGGREVQAYQMAYSTAGGRQVQGRGGSGHQPFLGEHSSDIALQAVRDAGVGRNGNFHWLPTGVLESRVHVFINAYANRVRFYVDLDEEKIRYVLGRIRHYCT